MNKKHSFSEIPAMRSKWKCNLCGKVLASKQNIEKHIEKLHPSCEKIEKHYTVEYVECEESNTSKKQSKPKTAYSFFSGMNNIFLHKDMCKDLTLYSHSSAPDTTSTVDMASREPDQDIELGTTEGEKGNTRDLDIPDTTGEFLPGLSNFISESLKSPLPIDNLETGSDISLTHLDTGFDESPPLTPSAEVLEETSTVIDIETGNPPSRHSGGDNINFKPPLKTRGGCGCEKCNKSNCGKCFNCLNRSKTK